MLPERFKNVLSFKGTLYFDNLHYVNVTFECSQSVLKMLDEHPINVYI